MRAALAEAGTALKNCEFPVGCVIVYNGDIIASGHRANSRADNELDHAEIRALRNLSKNHPEIEFDKLTLYSTLEPCLMCYSTILVNGIRHVVYGCRDVMGGGTGLHLSSLPPLYQEMQVVLRGAVLERECLSLLYDFFRNPQNTYLKDSLLARYILSQF